MEINSTVRKWDLKSLFTKRAIVFGFTDEDYDRDMLENSRQAKLRMLLKTLPKGINNNNNKLSGT